MLDDLDMHYSMVRIEEKNNHLIILEMVGWRGCLELAE